MAPRTRTQKKAATQTPASSVPRDTTSEDEDMAALHALQDEALEHDVVFVDDDGEDLPYAELKKLVDDAKEAERKAHEAAKAEAAKIQEGIAAREVAERRQKAAELKAAKRKVSTPSRGGIRLPPVEIMKGLGLPTPTDEDYTLAALHGYPVVVPGGKAYRTSISFNDMLAGDERPAGSVVLLIDAHASNKREYLEPVA